MKKLQTANLIPGMVTAEDIYSSNNQFILPKGLVLTDQSIQRLEFYSIFTIKVEDTSIEMLPTYDTQNSYQQKLLMNPYFLLFQTKWADAKSKYEEQLIAFLRTHDEQLLENMWSNIHTLASSCKQINLIDALQNLRDDADEIFTHCFQVALLCHEFARWLSLGRVQSKILVQSALLHDIGKLELSEALRRKMAPITSSDWQYLQSHCQNGYDLLKNVSISTHIKNAILMHHERCDGSGYPQNLLGQDIDYYAKWLAIADVYDAMLSPRIYRPALCPFQAIAYLEDLGKKALDYEAVSIFLEHILQTYIQYQVRLSNGLTGEIAFYNPKSFSKPTIKCEHQYIDLSQFPNITITEFL